MVTRYYYWDKYDLFEEWVDHEPGEYVDTRSVNTGGLSREHFKSWEVFSQDSSRISFMTLGAKAGSSKVELSGDNPKLTGRLDEDRFPEFNFSVNRISTEMYRSSAKVYYHESGNSFRPSGDILEADISWIRVYDKRWDSWFTDWRISHIRVENIKKLSLEKKTEYKTRDIGNWLETVLAPSGTYPRKGSQGGYWWVRGKEYTIEIPELIYPENGADFEEGPNHFEFELKERLFDCPGNYHARIRVGRRSDFNITTFMADSTRSADRGNFEYWNGDVWESFPSGGVAGDTKVRYTVPGSVDWDSFAFYYWDAIAYNSDFGYSPPARYRSFLNLGDTDDVYLLLINGIPYPANRLKLVESSNGRIGRMDIRLLNY
ncbi:hypothetical protein [Halarsenatibacter silvermanii]|uniref:Uncharacterized protein n=1 Tax=Halarsenatibacter silvermanii TaxID=321763 RepID=A0A1G9RD51_9FIRM|nr:hypothetical protein [Halarsenatibacter silvermanii]SDM21168.1 hypothetical protein SAMN04488692_12144 [Halarsenatibacter silvermanii]